MKLNIKLMVCLCVTCVSVGQKVLSFVPLAMPLCCENCQTSVAEDGGLFLFFGLLIFLMCVSILLPGIDQH